MGNAALDLLFPRRCPLCGKIADGICGECAKKLPVVRGPVCFQCGRPLADGDEEYCPDCRAHCMYFTQGRGLYLYNEDLRRSLHGIKYGNRREYLDVFAREMAVRLGGTIRRWDPQIVIPVPMHPAARRRRGYNQAELLARRLGEELGLAVCTDAVQKIRRTADQKTLDHRARRQNLKDAFAVDPRYMTRGETRRSLRWRRVLLVDDVFTTGSTMRELAKTLRRAGAEEVFFVTLCIVPGAPSVLPKLGQ